MTYSIFVNAQSLNLTCTNLTYSLTGLPNSWQPYPFFTNLQAGQTYIVRIKDNCTGCVYEKSYTIPQQHLIPKEDCPCCSQLDITVTQHAIQFSENGTVTLKVLSNACCEGPVTLVALPPLRNGLNWHSNTLAMVPMEIPKVDNVFRSDEIVLEFEVDPVNHGQPIEPFVVDLIFQGCDCRELRFVPVFFARL